MNILNYKLDTTKELLTSRIGLLATAHTINTLNLSNVIDKHFPALGSNRALKASTFINTLVLPYAIAKTLRLILTPLK